MTYDWPYTGYLDQTTAELRAEVRHHLSCVHDRAGMVLIHTEGATLKRPFCSRCSMVVFSAPKGGADWPVEL